MANKESIIQSEIMLALSEAGILVWRQQVGTFRAMYSDHVVKIGLPGMADLGAIVPVTITEAMVGRKIGVAAQIEVKTATGAQAKNQRLWELAVRNRSAIYTLSREPERVLDDLQQGVNSLYVEST